MFEEEVYFLEEALHVRIGKPWLSEVEWVLMYSPV